MNLSILSLYEAVVAFCVVLTIMALAYRRTLGPRRAALREQRRKLAARNALLNTVVKQIAAGEAEAAVHYLTANRLVAEALILRTAIQPVVDESKAEPLMRLQAFRPSYNGLAPRRRATRKAPEIHRQISPWIVNAAAAFSHRGDFLSASRLFSAIGQRHYTIQYLTMWAMFRKLDYKADLSTDEQKCIQRFFVAGCGNEPLARVVIERNLHIPVLLDLIQKRRSRQIAQFLRIAPSIKSEVLASVPLSDRNAETLATAFKFLGDFYFAGMVYQQAGLFAHAADAFQHAKEFERARYCHDRAGNYSVAERLWAAVRQVPYRRASSDTLIPLE